LQQCSSQSKKLFRLGILITANNFCSEVLVISFSKAVDFFMGDSFLEFLISLSEQKFVYEIGYLQILALVNHWYDILRTVGIIYIDSTTQIQVHFYIQLKDITNGIF
jgi:hypothetical protein